MTPEDVAPEDEAASENEEDNEEDNVDDADADDNADDDDVDASPELATLVCPAAAAAAAAAADRGCGFAAATAANLERKPPTMTDDKQEKNEAGGERKKKTKNDKKNSHTFLFPLSLNDVFFLSIYLFKKKKSLSFLSLNSKSFLSLFFSFSSLSNPGPPLGSPSVGPPHPRRDVLPHRLLIKGIIVPDPLR